MIELDKNEIKSTQPEIVNFDSVEIHLEIAGNIPRGQTVIIEVTVGPPVVDAFPEFPIWLN